MKILNALLIILINVPERNIEEIGVLPILMYVGMLLRKPLLLDFLSP